MPRMRRLFRTLRHLRWQQWWFRAWHPLAKRFARVRAGDIPAPPAAPVPLQTWTVPHSFDPNTGDFVFLNRKVHFGGRIDWEYAAEGALWQFNLQYFEWLYDERLSPADRLKTVSAFCSDTRPGTWMQAYPASLRIMAWTWFDLRHRVFGDDIRQRLFLDADWLRRFPEYHLDGNHLFENAIALCTAGTYFGNPGMLRQGEKILKTCIREQVYQDGGHCEGSPMYHSLLLWRLLQSLDILRALHPSGGPLAGLIETTAVRMLGWLRAMTFSDGSWPAVNDAAAGIAPEPAALFRAAETLGLKFPATPLSDSGYRLIRMPRYELFIDVDGIRPAWQPGHAHADTGNFCLHVQGRPVIVDTGCSSYEDPLLRMRQRGTAAHNTMAFPGQDSSEVWSRFRVGGRCRVLKLEEGPDRVRILYRDAAGNCLSRELQWNMNGIRISDRVISGPGKALIAFHAAPGLTMTKTGIADIVHFEYDESLHPQIVPAEIAAGFNALMPAACLLFYVNQQRSDIYLQLTSK